ncbi:MAG TPA: ROK family protein [Gammaproteobacteria bacterium]
MANIATNAPLYGGIEGGGSKFRCAVASAPDRILESATVPTTDPQTTLAECVRFFATAQSKHGPIAAFGVGCFGPIELRRQTPDFGRTLATPKAGWCGVDVIEPLRSAFSVPIALDTDVGAAALAELRLGAGRGVGSLAYVTVGTGIGGAVAPLNASTPRLMHAEMGHVPVRRDPRDSSFAGVCPFHGDCLEGLASGTAIRARWGCTLEELPAEHVGRSLVASYLGQLAASIALMVAVERIVFGGGVMSSGALLPLVRAAAFEYLNGYVAPLRDAALVANYICGPGLGDDAGIVGALLLAITAVPS